MEGLLVAAIAPVLVILFALSMERIEGRLSQLTVQRKDVQDFIETHAPADLLAPDVDLLAAAAPPRPADAIGATR